MKHKIGFNKLNMMPAHRKATIRNMMTVLFEHERITTTHAKAMEVRRFAEKEITGPRKIPSTTAAWWRARSGTRPSSRSSSPTSAPASRSAKGGYTRILRLG